MVSDSSNFHLSYWFLQVFKLPTKFIQSFGIFTLILQYFVYSTRKYSRNHFPIFSITHVRYFSRLRHKLFIENHDLLDVPFGILCWICLGNNPDKPGNFIFVLICSGFLLIKLFFILLDLQFSLFHVVLYTLSDFKLFSNSLFEIS